MRERVLRLGWNASAYQLLAPGFSHWLAPDHDAAVGYVRHAGVRVAAGAPVAREADVAEAAAAFEVEARRHGDAVCWFAAEARLTSAFEDAPDHDRVLLGGLPVWDPRRWREVVRTHTSVRSQLSRARNKGLRVDAWRDPSTAQLAELRELQADWLARKALPRLHFLTEVDTLRSLRDRHLLVASVGERPVGFLVASPVPTRAGWLVEQVVRTAAAPNGTAESLIDAMMRAAAEEGSGYLTLGLVPLAQRAELPRDTPPRWLALTLRLVRAYGQRFYNFAGLEHFKAKLAPERWDPVYAIANEARFSPRTLYAIAGAFAGGPPPALVTRALVRAAAEETRGRLAQAHPVRAR
ncbi:MAG: DUF2156 domain-containing protein [Trueperaceae bacterium]|nr:DUF2156 domain-containing protein [Trueperaceae bacterium]